MWERIRRLTHGSEKTEQHRHSRLVDEFENFVAVEGESLSFVYERLTTLVNVMDRNEIHPLPITIKLRDKFTTAMMLLVRAITQRYSTPTNNRLRTSSKTMNQAVIQDGKPNVQCYNYNAKGHYAHDCPQPKVCDTKYFREHMLLAMKDEAGENLNEEENDFMLNNHYGDDSLKELNAALIMMEHIQLVENKADAEPTYDADALGEVNASHIHLKSRMHSKSVHKHTNHVKLKNAINTSDDDQIDSSIIFDDPYV
ncbi:integrase, catalytic region, zinc finger, CCHC-type containing protein [Tanacetum coccineum]